MSIFCYSRPTSSTSAAQENASERSPFAEAQLAKVRRSAQEVLQSLLETQSRLESRGVDHWAADDFLAASAVALEGDALYRAKDFEAAEALYQQALDSLIGSSFNTAFKKYTGKTPTEYRKTYLKSAS